MKQKTLFLTHDEDGHKVYHLPAGQEGDGRKPRRNIRRSLFAAKSLDDKIMRYTGIKDIMG